MRHHRLRLRKRHRALAGRGKRRAIATARSTTPTAAEIGMAHTTRPWWRRLKKCRSQEGYNGFRIVMELLP